MIINHFKFPDVCVMTQIRNDSPHKLDPSLDLSISHIEKLDLMFPIKLFSGWSDWTLRRVTFGPWAVRLTHLF